MNFRDWLIIESMTPQEAAKILGVQIGASEDVIRKAFKKLAIQYHPDRGGDHAMMAKINSAMEVLSQQNQRQRQQHQRQQHQRQQHQQQQHQQQQHQQQQQNQRQQHQRQSWPERFATMKQNFVNKYGDPGNMSMSQLNQTARKIQKDFGI